MCQEIFLKYERSKAKNRAQFEVMTLELENKVGSKNVKLKVVLTLLLLPPAGDC